MAHHSLKAYLGVKKREFLINFTHLPTKTISGAIVRDMKKSTLTAFLAITFSLLSPVFAKTIVISDIDDTLKMAHVKALGGQVSRAFMTKITFAGMPELLNEIAKQKKVSSFYYLSNAPEFLMKRSHTKFIAVNKYPAGKIILKSKESKEEHKIINIKKIIETEKPDEIIFFGDNGERDSVIYREAMDLYPEIKFNTYIHYVYPNAIEADQTAFVTALEPLLSLISEGVLPLTSYITASKLAVAIANEGERETFKVQYFPEFLNCSGFQLSLPANDLRVLNYKNAIKKINTVCGN